MTLPDWYDATMAASDRLHDGVAWRCRLHGLLTAQYVIILADLAYCGSCADGPAQPIPLVSRPQTVAPEDWNAPAHRRAPVRVRPYPGPGTRAEAILVGLRRAGSRGLRHTVIVGCYGNTARKHLADLAQHRMAVRNADGSWRAL